MCNRLGTIPLFDGQTVKQHRLRHVDLIFCYKIIHGYVSLSPDNFFTVVRDHRTRGHSLKVFVPDARVNCRKHFFAVRVINVWNSLPDEVVQNSYKTNKFK